MATPAEDAVVVPDGLALPPSSELSTTAASSQNIEKEPITPGNPSTEGVEDEVLDNDSLQARLEWLTDCFKEDDLIQTEFLRVIRHFKASISNLEVDKQRLQTNIDNLKQKFRILQSLASYKSTSPEVEQAQEQFHQEYLAEYYGASPQTTPIEAPSPIAAADIAAAPAAEPVATQPVLRQTQSKMTMLPSAPSKPYELKVTPFELPRTVPAGTLLPQTPTPTTAGRGSNAPLLLRQRSNTTMPSSSSTMWSKPPAASIPKISGAQSTRALPMLESTPMSSTYTPGTRPVASAPQAPAPVAVIDSIMASEQEKAFPNPLAPSPTPNSAAPTGAVVVPVPTSPELPAPRPIVRSTASATNMARLPPVRRSTVSALGSQNSTIISNPTPSEKRLSGMILPSLAEKPPVFAPIAANPSGSAAPAVSSSTTADQSSASPSHRRPLLRAPTNTPGEVAVLDPNRTMGPANPAVKPVAPTLPNPLGPKAPGPVPMPIAAPKIPLPGTKRPLTMAPIPLPAGVRATQLLTPTTPVSPPPQMSSTFTPLGSTAMLRATSPPPQQELPLAESLAGSSMTSDSPLMGSPTSSPVNPMEQLMSGSAPTGSLALSNSLLTETYNPMMTTYGVLQSQAMQAPPTPGVFSPADLLGQLNMSARDGMKQKAELDKIRKQEKLDSLQIRNNLSNDEIRALMKQKQWKKASKRVDVLSAPGNFRHLSAQAEIVEMERIFMISKDFVDAPSKKRQEEERTFDSSLALRLRMAKDMISFELDLSGCNLTFVPLVVSDNFAKVRLLDLSKNRLSAFPNGLVGTIPFDMLEELNLAGNVITAVPPTINRLPRLHVLRLDDNQLTSLPVELAQLPQLEFLDVSGNAITELPKWIGHMQGLRYLDLSRCPITSLPSEIGHCRELEWLDVTGCKLAKLPKEISACMQLRHLRAAGNPLAKLPSTLGVLPKLEELVLSNCKLTDIPIPMGQCTSLAAEGALFEIHGNPFAPAELVDAATKKMNNKDLMNLLAQRMAGQKLKLPQVTLPKLSSLAKLPETKPAIVDKFTIQEKMLCIGDWANSIIETYLHPALSQFSQQTRQVIVEGTDEEAREFLEEVAAVILKQLKLVFKRSEDFLPRQDRRFQLDTTKTAMEQFQAIVVEELTLIEVSLRQVKDAIRESAARERAEDIVRVVSLVHYLRDLALILIPDELLNPAAASVATSSQSN